MLSENILNFNQNLSLPDDELPGNFGFMNPFQDDPHGQINRITETFYRKYYNDNQPRKILLGINPGRHGAGVTGIPFTDTERLENVCGIDPGGFSTYEPSSVFVYAVIDAFGGPETFYSSFYVNSLSPLGYTTVNKKGNTVNANYYDDKQLQEAVEPFMIAKLQEQISWGLDTDVCYCLGKGKHFAYFNKLNKKHRFFDKVVPLEHPRYVVQYKWKKRDEYILKYLKLLKGEGI